MAGLQIDAKSIVGIFSVELSQPVKLCIYADGEEAEKILGHLSDYLVQFLPFAIQI